jgi:hypothetical protein
MRREDFTASIEQCADRRLPASQNECLQMGRRNDDPEK